MELIKMILQNCLIFISVLYSCNGQNAEINNGLNSFAIKLLSETASIKDARDLNVALSPYTVWTLMSIIAEGARDETARQLEVALHIPKNKTKFRDDFRNLSTRLSQIQDGTQIDISNALFCTTQPKLYPMFQKITKHYYGVDIEQVDFKSPNAATKIINDYVRKVTRNRISNFINRDDVTDAEIFMTSVLYFKGQWKLPFNKTATKREPFYDENEIKIGEVDMMYQMGFFPFSRIDQLRSIAVELQYGRGDAMSMILLLPYKNEKMETVLKLMENTQFTDILNALGRAEQEFMDEDVQVYLPRFIVKSDFNLNVVLQEMGIRDVFDYGKSNLLNIFPHYLTLSRVIQRAEIEVNEEGTVATSAAGGSLAYKSPPPKFLANKPFLYFIVNKQTGSIIFTGKISNPNQLS